MESEVNYPSDMLSWEECMALLERFPGLSVEERAVAIRRLVRNPSTGIRQRALQMGAEVFSDDELTAFLRSELDDVVRNMGLEILKLKGARAKDLALQLLHDPDPDVVMQAVLVLDSIGDPDTLEALRATLLTAANDDVSQAAILAIGHVGRAVAVDDLLPLLKANTWLQTAAIEALGYTGSEAAMNALSRFLRKEFAGHFAATSIARIGGRKACKLLAKRWIKFQDTETLKLLTAALANLNEKPPKIKGLEEALSQKLEDADENNRIDAANALLAMGSSNMQACAVLAATGDPSGLPASMQHRKDLIQPLLSESGTLQQWGILLAAKYPEVLRKKSSGAMLPLLARAASEAAEPGPELLDLLARVRNPLVAATVLDLFLKSPEENRPAFEGVLQAHRKELRRLLAEREIARDARIVLAAQLGEPVAKVAQWIAELSQEERLAVLPQTLPNRKLVRKLPWKKWLAEDPPAYAGPAAEAIIGAEMASLIPVLRKQLAQSPEAELIRAAGEVRDEKSVGFLARALGTGTPLTDALIVENLGRIGGEAARAVLRARASAPEHKDDPMVLRALAQCATAEDSALFREASTHHDWRVRFAVAEALARFRIPENEEVLARLASDPSPIVAQKAKSS